MTLSTTYTTFVYILKMQIRAKKKKAAPAKKWLTAGVKHLNASRGQAGDIHEGRRHVLSTGRTVPQI